MRLQCVIATALMLALPAVVRAQGAIQPVQAKTIEPYTAKTIEPYHAATPASARSTAPRADSAQAIGDVKDLPRPAEAPRARPARLDAFFGKWQLSVEGASYTTDDFATGTRTVTTSSGARGRRLVIRANGTYDWGGHRGRWRRTGEGAGGYPLVLLRADHGEDWKIGWDTRRGAPAGRMLVWDGYVWEVGTRR